MLSYSEYLGRIFSKKSLFRCPIFQFHTSIECKGYENRRIQPYHPTDAQQLESVCAKVD